MAVGHTEGCNKRIGDELDKVGDETLEHAKEIVFDYLEERLVEGDAKGESANAQDSSVKASTSTSLGTSSHQRLGRIR
jgi:hypothetical protein